MSDNFKWTDQLIKEYISKKLGLPAEHPYHLQQLEDFKKSKEPDVPKEWEVVEIDGYDSERRYLMNGLYRFYEDGVGFELDYLLRQPDSKIYSVRRLRDGMVFSVGDKVRLTTSGFTGVPKFFIDNFYSEGNSMFVNKCNGRWNILSLTKCLNQDIPLFTTEDGIDVYKYDTFPVYKVTYPNFDLIENEGFDAHPISSTCKCFADKEKAEEYRFYNKPVSMTYSEYRDCPFEEMKLLFHSKIYK